MLERDVDDQDEFLNASIADGYDSIDEPKTLHEAINSPYATEWKEAIEDELASLHDNKTWVLQELPKGRKSVGSKWVFKVKRNADVSVQRFKARLVAKGFTQVEGVDYVGTWAPVLSFTSMRLLLKIAIDQGLLVHQMDVKTAFLNGDLEEEIYMDQPKGFETGGPRVKCKLLKSVYGLKQAPKVWNDLLNKYLIKLGFQ